METTKRNLRSFLFSAARCFFLSSLVMLLCEMKEKVRILTHSPLHAWFQWLITIKLCLFKCWTITCFIIDIYFFAICNRNKQWERDWRRRRGEKELCPNRHKLISFFIVTSFFYFYFFSCEFQLLTLLFMFFFKSVSCLFVSRTRAYCFKLFFYFHFYDRWLSGSSPASCLYSRALNMRQITFKWQ